MPTQPIRLQLRRTKGFRLQEASFRANGLPAVKVDRGAIFGNPFDIEILGRRGAIDAFKRLVSGEMNDEEIRRLSRSAGWNDEGVHLKAVQRDIQSKIELLRGRNLACWCAQDQPCHADVLLQFANAGIQFSQSLDPTDRVQDLEKENARLRRLVTDLTLEKQVRKDSDSKGP